jgi:hypothetical protein
MPKLLACGPGALPGRCLGALDEAAVGHAILAPRAAGDSMPCREAPPTHNRADAGDGVPPVESVGLGRLGRLDDRQCHSAAQPILGGT